MNIFRLVYCSRATVPMDLAEMMAILQVAQERNARDELTGMLCFNAPYFFQCLEGPQAAVSRTLGRIYQDPRHADIMLVDARFAPERAFSNWAMKLVESADLPNDLVQKLFEEPSKAYTTARLDAERLLNFLEQVCKRTAITPAPTGPKRSGTLTHTPRRTGG